MKFAVKLLVLAAVTAFVVGYGAERTVESIGDTHTTYYSNR